MTRHGIQIPTEQLELFCRSNRIRRLALFGSILRDDFGPESDIDVLVVGDVDFASVLAALYDAQAVLQREINPKVFSTQEWAEQLQSPSSFVRDLLDKPRVMLIGDGHGR